MMVKKLNIGLGLSFGFGAWALSQIPMIGLTPEQAMLPAIFGFIMGMYV